MNKSQRDKLFNDFILPHLRKNRYITRKELRDIFDLQDNDLLIIVNEEGRMKRIKQGIYTLPDNNDIVDILKHKRVRNPRAEETAEYLEGYIKTGSEDDWDSLLEDIYMDC